MLYEAIGEIEIRVTAVDNAHSVNYAVMAFKNEQFLERIEGSIDKGVPYDGSVMVDINKLKNKFYPAY